MPSRRSAARVCAWFARDELGTGLRVAAVVERLAEREHAPAHAVTRLEDRDAQAELLEPLRAGEPRQPGTDDDHVAPLRLQREGHSRGGAEELAPREH